MPKSMGGHQVPSEGNDTDSRSTGGSGWPCTWSHAVTSGDSVPPGILYPEGMSSRVKEKDTF